MSSECPGAGVCARPGEPTRPHACFDDTVFVGDDCMDTPPVDRRGECAASPSDQRCSLASGHPQRGCLNDADCGGMTGSCETAPRKCYLDLGAVGGSVSASGVATPPSGNTADPTALTALSCLTATGFGSVNAVGGFPGLARGVYPGRAIYEVEIVGTFTTGTPPSGYMFLGRLVQITAEPATAASPLVVSFDIDASEIPLGQDETTIEVFRNGVGPIPNCLGATQAIPDNLATGQCWETTHVSPFDKFDGVSLKDKAD